MLHNLSLDTNIMAISYCRSMKKDAVCSNVVANSYVL